LKDNNCWKNILLQAGKLLLVNFDEEAKSIEVVNNCGKIEKAFIKILKKKLLVE